MKGALNNTRYLKQLNGRACYIPQWDMAVFIRQLKKTDFKQLRKAAKRATKAVKDFSIHINTLGDMAGN